MQKPKIHIGVTGVGGGVGESIVKSLYKTPYSIIGLDADPLAVGLYACDRSRIIPRYTDLQYIRNILSICREEEIAVLFPGLDPELQIFSEHKDEFEKQGVCVVVSDPTVIRTCDDKYETNMFLCNHGISAPKTMIMKDFLKNPEIMYPIILKIKKGGSRSKGMYIIKNEKQLLQIASEKELDENNNVIQEYIEGDEYTCGSVNFNGTCYGVIIMKRILRDGDTYKCFSVKNERIEKVVKKTMEILKPFGACNVQLRLKNGIPYIFEINARCSGTTAARTLCGFNEPKMIVEYLTKGQISKPEVKELSILRYWKEYALENDEIHVMQDKKTRTKSRYKEL